MLQKRGEDGRDAKTAPRKDATPKDICCQPGFPCHGFCFPDSIKCSFAAHPFFSAICEATVTTAICGKKNMNTKQNMGNREARDSGSIGKMKGQWRLRLKWAWAQQRAAWLMKHPTCKYVCDGWGDVEKRYPGWGENSLVQYALARLMRAERAKIQLETSGQHGHWARYWRQP